MEFRSIFELHMIRRVIEIGLMSSALSGRRLSPDDLQKLPDEAAFELVDGALVERHLGAESSAIALRIAFLFGLFLRDHPLGRVFGSDTGYQCFLDDPKRVRRADLGFVRFDRLPGGRAPKGHCRVAPDLTVEVVSPNDTVDELQEKIAEYLGAGFPLIWVVNPPTRTVQIYRPRTAPSGPISILSEDDTITGENALPGFSCLVKEFFV
jgi:Uma2 family endonuclease